MNVRAARPLPVKILLFGFGLCVLLFLLSLLALVIAEKTVPAPQGRFDAVIVLGAQVYPDGSPSIQLKGRLDAAFEAWRSQTDLTVVVCGGQGADEPRAEGDVMKEYLTALGVPEAQVLSDTVSGSTRENVLMAVSLLPGKASRVLVVTSDYHLPRALAIARDAGLEAQGIGAPTLPEWWIKNHTREVLAWGKYLLGRLFG